MPKKSHYSYDDDYNTGYTQGIRSAQDDELLDPKDQDQEARELYEMIEGHEVGCECECEYCRLIGDFGSFEEGFGAGYTTEYERKHGR
jgi:hypothetical protein